MMTAAEIRRHVRGIQRLRESAQKRNTRERFERGYFTGQDFDADNRRALRVSTTSAYSDVGAVDTVFAARERSGRLPRGSW